MATTAAVRKPTLKFFEDQNGNWYWHVQSGNGKLIDNGAQGGGFSRLQRAIDNFNISTRNRLVMIGELINIPDKQLATVTGKEFDFLPVIAKKYQVIIQPHKKSATLYGE